jgi:hypothetical protein
MIPTVAKGYRRSAKKDRDQAGLTPWTGGDDWAREAHQVYGADEEHIVGLTVSCNYFSCHFSNGMNRLADGDEHVVLLAAFKIR